MYLWKTGDVMNMVECYGDLGKVRNNVRLDVEVTIKTPFDKEGNVGSCPLAWAHKVAYLPPVTTSIESYCPLLPVTASHRQLLQVVTSQPVTPNCHIWDKIAQ